MTATVFTSTISTELDAWLHVYAKKLKTTRRSIIERALENLRHEIKREEFRKGFQRMANDKEMIEMAEWGLADYAKQLKQYDL